jgi:hypothetical protein
LPLVVFKRSYQPKVELCGWEMGSKFSQKMPDFHVAIRDLLHAVNIQNGTHRFTSLLKEGVLRSFLPWQIWWLHPGLNLRTWVLKASTLPLDHRSCCSLSFPLWTIELTASCSYEWIHSHVLGCYLIRQLLVVSSCWFLYAHSSNQQNMWQTSGRKGQTIIVIWNENLALSYMLQVTVTSIINFWLM